MTKAELPPKSPAAKVESVVLRASIHCEGCRRKIKRIIYAVDGVEEVNIEAESGKVTVTGKSLDAKEIVQRLQKSGKQAEIWGGGVGPAKAPNMNTINPNKQQQQQKQQGKAAAAATGASFPNTESKEKQQKPGKQQQEKNKGATELPKGGAGQKQKDFPGGGEGAADFFFDDLDDENFDFPSPVKPAAKTGGGKKGGKRGGNGGGGGGGALVGNLPDMDHPDFMNIGAAPVQNHNNRHNNQFPPPVSAPGLPPGFPGQTAGVNFHGIPAGNNMNSNFVANRNMNFPAPDYVTTGYALQQSAEYATHMFSDENANACAVM